MDLMVSSGVTLTGNQFISCGLQERRMSGVRMSIGEAKQERTIP